MRIIYIMLNLVYGGSIAEVLLDDNMGVIPSKDVHVAGLKMSFYE